MTLVPFRTRNLHMRPLQASDRGLYLALYTSESVMRHIGPALSKEAADLAFDRYLRQVPATPGKWWIWVVKRTSGEESLGILAAKPQGTEAELGIMLLPGARKGGSGREALAGLALQLLSYELLESVHARHSSSNRAAARIMGEMRGFRRTQAGDWVIWRLQRSRLSELQV